MAPGTGNTPTTVTGVPPADAQIAGAHFKALLAFETDCWDVHAALASGPVDFVLLDVRGEGGFRVGHVDGAVHLPHTSITADNLVGYAAETVFVVYCAGPHCNGADKAAVRLADLGRPVKKMIGGIEGWKDEGFDLNAE
jgi:rhodanese-related sulfurtransferase